MASYKHAHTFHNYRFKGNRNSGLINRLWHFHDEHPLPAPVNKVARKGVYYLRRAHSAIRTPKPVDGRDEYGDRVVPKQSFLAPRRSFTPPPLGLIEARFRLLHEMNEHLYNGDGSWEMNEHAYYYGSGVPIEEVSYRVLGYLSAHETFGDPVFLERAVEGGRYLLRERLFADGHMRLESHLVIELEYTFAGLALLALYRSDPSATEYLDAACRIGDRLVEEHCTGCVDHATIPAQLLGPLYQLTGRQRYLRAALYRVLTYAVPLQLPYGGWEGEDSFTWYHSIIVKSALAAYLSTPNTLAFYAKKDRIARTVTAGINRLLACQNPDGSLRMGRGNVRKDYNYTGHTVHFEDGGFVRTSSDLDSYVGPNEIDVLVSGFEDLAVQPAAIAAHGYAHAMLASDVTCRPEFDTFALARYASFLVGLRGVSEQTRAKLGMAEG